MIRAWKSAFTASDDSGILGEGTRRAFSGGRVVPGCITSTPEGVRRVSEDEVLSADVIVLCVAISAFEEVLTHISGRIEPGRLVMDTCSVKMHPARAMERILKPDIHILATHPMFGPDSGRDGLDGLPWFSRRFGCPGVN